MSKKREKDAVEVSPKIETYACQLILDEAQILDCVKQVLCSRGYLVGDAEIELDDMRQIQVIAYVDVPINVVPPAPEVEK